jgi:PAS domain S-box-containing protein
LAEDLKSLDRPIKAGDLTPQINSEFGLRQLSEIMRALPIYTFYHLIATGFMSFLVEEPKDLLRYWQVAAACATVVIVALIFKCRGFQNKPKSAALLLRAMPIVAVAMAAIWAVPATTFINRSSADSVVLIYGITLIIWALGVLTWLRMPSVAVLYASFVGVIMCWSIYTGLPQHQILFALVCAGFWLSLIGLIVTAHIDFERKTRHDLELARQGQIIKLLLNDFERDTSDWLWETDSEGKLTYYSPRLSEVLGLHLQDLHGTDFAALLTLGDNTPFPGKFDLSAAPADVALDYKTAIKARGELTYWHLKARALVNGAGQFTGYRGVGHDVTSQHVSEAQILAAKEAAESASAAKSQFLAIISHELRTPINSIVGFCEVLNNHQGENISARHRQSYLSSVIESARHLQNLINDILDATRLERGSFQLVEQENDAAEIVEVTLKMCRNQADTAKINIVANVIEDVNVRGDLTRLKQVMLNLMNNAIKFSPPDTIINVAMQSGTSRELIISIRDAGIGISEDDAVRVFEPFVQIDGGSTRSYGGMGLGLAIARRIARLHGGDVTLDGSMGIGTEARLVLPADRIAWPASKSASSQVAA